MTSVPFRPRPAPSRGVDLKPALTLSLHHRRAAEESKRKVPAQPAIPPPDRRGPRVAESGRREPQAERGPPRAASPPRPRAGDPAPPSDGPAPTVERPRQALCALLAATAHAHPQRIAFVDPVDKPLWSGRAAITWTYAAAAEIVARLANGLKGWRLPPGSRIGLCLAGGSESWLAYLAVEAAGHIPCLLPLIWDEDALVAGVQAAGIAAVLTQARVGASAPAERLRRVAVRYFGLRYLAAFGPDVPDGVIGLDGMVLDGRGGAFAPEAGGLVSFAGGDPNRPMHRPGDGLLGSIVLHLVAARVAPEDRVLTLLPPSDLRGLVTGLGAALVAGASLETLPVFDAAGFAAALARPGPTHLVVPAGLERNLAASRCPEGVRSVTLAHRAPTRLGARLLRPTGDPDAPRAVIDAVAFDETVILTVVRGQGDLALTLAQPEQRGAASALMEMRCDADGRLAFRGHACTASPLQRGIPARRAAEDWASTPFRVSVLAGRATAITRS